MSILKGLSERWKDKTKPGLTPLSPEQVLEALKAVVDPDLHQDIVSLGFIHKLVLEGQGEKVAFELRLTTPACPVKEELKAQCEQAVLALPGVKEVAIHVSSQARETATTAKASPLARVKHLVAVAAGKGGVGKSTVAMNLARSLALAGAKVGLLDADVYGPSLSIMAHAGKPRGMQGELVLPPEVEGIKIISPAMFASEDKAQILRGPMAASFIRQLLLQVAWGELDYLIMDYPPGTGDIQLTISQVAQVAAAIMVTTPQDIALADVRKAISMFQTLKVPLLGVVENMSYFVCDGCEKRHFLFRQGGGRRLAQEFGLPLLGEIPLDSRVAVACDQGEAVAMPEKGGEKLAACFQELAGNVARELSILNMQASAQLGSFTLNWKV